jgi:hypothetical protein
MTSTLTYWVRTEHDTLAPVDAITRDWMHQHDWSEPVVLAPVHDSKFRGYVFRTLHEIANAAGIEAEDLRLELLIQTERFQVRQLFGRGVLIPQSMSPSAMSDKQLRAFWRDAQPHLRFLIRARVGDAAKRAEIDAMLMPAGESEHAA